MGKVKTPGMGRSHSEALVEDQKTKAESFGRSRSALEDEGRVLRKINVKGFYKHIAVS